MKKFVIVLLAAGLVPFGCQKEELSQAPARQKSAAGVECITFDTPFLAAGTIPTELYTDALSGPVGVNGINPNYPDSNAAMIFNSAAPTGGDTDLGTPHTDFGGPGVGVGGKAGATYENNTALGNLLIVTEDWDQSDPNDLRGQGVLEFDFSAIGAVSVHGLTIVDIEGKEGAPTTSFYDAADNLITSIPLVTVGDNGVAHVSFGPVTGVMKMKVALQGSGAIDNLCIELPPPPPPSNGCTHTIGYWRNHAGFGPQPDMVSQYLPINLGQAGGAKTLAVTNNSIAVDVLKQKVYGKPNNGITKLYAQLLATKLSMADGADGTPIATVVADADAFLANHDWNDWNSLSKSMKKTVNGWKDDLDDYNNGKMGTPHCD